MGQLFTRPASHHPGESAPGQSTKSAILHRGGKSVPPAVRTGSDNTYQPHASWSIFDGSGGAAVSILGHGFMDRIWPAVTKAVYEADYAPSAHWTNGPAETAANLLIQTTRGHFAKCVFYNSGSDAMESAMKLARQYFCRIGESERVWFISRRQSYHGATLGALALGGHVARREDFEPLLMTNVDHISACNVYRDREQGMTDGQYIQQKVDELEEAFQRHAGKVVAFVAEPIVGAALGCATPPQGYLTAMKQVCHKHGALFIGDEIMCGFGRTGTLHAWEQEETSVPDIQVMGKGISAGVQPVAAMLCSQRIIDAVGREGQSFVHGHTFQNHSASCAAVIETLRILQEHNLLDNVRRQGALLKRLLVERLGHQPHIGDIRGHGLFIALEFVRYKATKEPFDPELHVYQGFHEKGLERSHRLYLYPGGGTKDGVSGDHSIIAPPYNITQEQVHKLVDKIEKLYHDYFDTLSAGLEKSAVLKS